MEEEYCLLSAESRIEVPLTLVYKKDDKWPYQLYNGREELISLSKDGFDEFVKNIVKIAEKLNK
jgi:hypothetical protein